MRSTALNIPGWYQLLGGAHGIIVLLYRLISAEYVDVSLIIVYAVGLCLFGYSVICGQMCLNSPAKEVAVKHSIINQSIQLATFSIPGILFGYAAGFHLGVLIQFTDRIDLRLSTGLSKFALSLNSYGDLYMLNVNLIAVALLISLLRIRKSLIQKKLEELADSSFETLQQ